MHLPDGERVYETETAIVPTESTGSYVSAMQLQLHNPRPATSIPNYASTHIACKISNSMLQQVPLFMVMWTSTSARNDKFVPHSEPKLRMLLEA